MQLTGAEPLQHAERSTRYAQPAIFLASLAGWRAAKAEGVQPFAFAGHSLGELTALTAAGALAPECALELVALRGRLMDEACRDIGGGMLAILGGTVAQAERLALANGVRVANYNAPEQTVLAGASARLETAMRDARALGLRALRLGVSGPFHTPALMPARVRFQQALAAVPIAKPRAPVISSMTTQPFTDPASQLGAALVRPVRWAATMQTLQRLGAGAYLDVGPGRILERLTSSNLPNAVLIESGSLRVPA